MPRTVWSANAAGWHMATVRVGERPVLVALMREHASTWRWIGFANGRPLGRFDGLANAKREAPKLARKEWARDLG